ncbi:MAG TPA: HEPN domain-containing protein [Planctomycetota bacterium]|nr:HEPN domain-containing protein [Planctomycetota bacterium]
MEDKTDTIQRWLARAEHDLLTAQTMLALPNAPTDVVCFHCQQCMEKALKAWLAYAQRDFPKTHDLQRLLSLCSKDDDEFRHLGENAVALADYAVETRYVDDWREIPKQEAVDAVAWASMALEFVRRKVGLS